MAGHMRLEVWHEKSHENGEGWYGRYSAPGYMDCTDDCGPFPSAIEAARETAETFGMLDERGSEDRDELAALLWRLRDMGNRGRRAAYACAEGARYL
jgi:hypothetical protein